MSNDKNEIFKLLAEIADNARERVQPEAVKSVDQNRRGLGARIEVGRRA